MGNPNERWNKMGYYKNLEVELQEIIDPHLREIIEWKRAHQHMLTGQELWDIMTDEKKQDAALVRWRNEKNLPAPKRAVDHVALQVTRRRLRRRKPDTVVVGWALIGLALFTGVTILVVTL
jgi:hypothetical protein